MLTGNELPVTGGAYAFVTFQCRRSLIHTLANDLQRRCIPPPWRCFLCPANIDHWRRGFPMLRKSRFIRRSLVLSLIMALVAVMLPTDASAFHRRIIRKNSFAASFQGPDIFTCYWFDEAAVHQYVCAGDTEGPFLLGERLDAGDTPPNPEVVGDLAVPARFNCRYIGDPASARSADLFTCAYRHKHSRRGITHKHRFLLSEAVLVTLEDDPSAPPSQLTSIWVAPHPVKKKPHHAGPVAGSHRH
jgi:hypothetical protein